MRRKHFQARFSIQDGTGSKDLKSFIVVLYTIKKKEDGSCCTFPDAASIDKDFDVHQKARRHHAGAQIILCASDKEPYTMVDNFVERIAILEARIYSYAEVF